MDNCGKQVVSLFSGAGGLDLGLIQAGHRIIWANDFDKDCATTYRHNIGDHFELASIEDISSKHIPDCDVVVGGFPCQGFSQANLLRFEEDERNRLYSEFLRVIRDKKPKWFLAENVRGILSLGGGAVIRKIEADFAAVGYRVQKRLFNTADYGVPQSRWRVIIAGTRDDLPSEFDYSYPEPTHSSHGSGNLLPWVSIGEAVRNLPEPDTDHKFVNHIFSQYKVTNRNFTGHRTTDHSKPSPTILARGNGKGGVCAIQHPNNHRRMSIREQASIQTFPLDFEFYGKMNSCYRQVGNAVPVLFGKHLGDQLGVLGLKEKVAS
jgi:DNA (cytosine-5)-methyltransferase 1